MKTFRVCANRVTTFTATNGVTTTFDHDSRGRITHRYTALGYSDYVYEDGTDWLSRETWYPAAGGNPYDLVRYSYTNGRPSRVQVPIFDGNGNLAGYSTYYIQYDWHGDAIWFLPPGVSSVNYASGAYGGQVYDAWGNSPSPQWGRGYYLWNAAWGYLKFNELGLYYVHGRWYNPDTGMFLSPDAKGDYMYGGSGQDAVNLVRQSQSRCDPVKGRGYLRTSKYGYIDKAHFEDSKKIADRILDNLGSGKTEFGEEVSMDSYGLRAGVHIDYYVPAPVPETGVQPWHWESLRICRRVLRCSSSLCLTCTTLDLVLRILHRTIWVFIRRFPATI